MKKIEKRKIRIYLQYPWKFPDSPYYKPLIKNPPKNIEFLNTEEQKGAMTNIKKFWLSNFLKKNIRKSLHSLNSGILNAHLTKSNEKYDLIHCAHCLSLNKNKPWIADFECGWQFFVGKENKNLKDKATELILLDNCKKIVAWTKETKEEMLNFLPKIKNKIKIIYPAIPMPKIKRKKHKGINLVFVARYFDLKGGYHALEAMKRLTKKYNDVQGIIVSTVPKKIIEENKNNKKITFYHLIPQKEMFEKVYSIADISVYPGYADSFGFGILEAMSFGIPVISVNGYSRKETITDGKTGFVINFPKGAKSQHDFNWKKIDGFGEKVIQDIVKKTSELIENKILLKKMSENALSEIKNGRFSIEKRNRKMEEIYKNAVKKRK